MTETALAEEPARRHPRAGGVAQIHALWIVVTIFGLVTDDHDRNVLASTAAKEGVDALEHRRIRDAPAINLALQPLPRQFTIRQQANVVSDGLLAAAEFRAQEAALSRDSEEHLIIGDKGIVEIESDTVGRSAHLWIVHTPLSAATDTASTAENLAEIVCRRYADTDSHPLLPNAKCASLSDASRWQYSSKVRPGWAYHGSLCEID